MTKEQRAAVDKLVADATDKGKLIEAGWVAIEYLSLRDHSILQRFEMRKAFFFGAQHLFGSIMQILEPGAEPTDKDLARMDLIQKELDEFVRSLNPFTSN